MNNSSVIKQRGNILVMFTIGLFVLFAMAALALDGGHLLLNKTRLQNIVDASALNAAKELDYTVNHTLAIAAALEILELNLDHADYHELKSSIDLSEVVIEFSLEPNDFVNVLPGESNYINARYVRVSIKNINLSNFLAQIFSFTKNVSATALAGPSTALVSCYSDLVPMMVCSKPIDNTADPLTYPEGTVFGFSLGELTVMKIGSGEDSAVGSGNFQLIDLPGDQGGADIRQSMAGAGLPGPETCFATAGEDSELDTAPGNKVGPALQGLNTRFEGGTIPGGKGTVYEADDNTCQGERLDLEDGVLVDSDDDPVYQYDTDGNLIPLDMDAYRYSHYIPGTSGAEICPSPGVANPAANERRILNVVISECDGTLNGNKVPTYVGSGCFFLTQDIDKGGQQSFVIGEFVEDCTAEGIPDIDSVNNPGPYTIVLYHDPDSKDS